MIVVESLICRIMLMLIQKCIPDFFLVEGWSIVSITVAVQKVLPLIFLFEVTMALKLSWSGETALKLSPQRCDPSCHHLNHERWLQKKLLIIFFQHLHPSWTPQTKKEFIYLIIIAFVALIGKCMNLANIFDEKGDLIGTQW